MKADGSDFKRLTTENNIRHFYPSLSPDGQSVVYSAFYAENNYDVYQLDIADGSQDRLTSSYGSDTAPEISPDKSQLVFAHISPNTNKYQIMLADQLGNNAGNIPSINGWDPTWSPDGKVILFASDKNGTIQLYTIRPDGSKLTRITNLPAIRGRSDWSPDGKWVVFTAYFDHYGEDNGCEIYIIRIDGTDLRRLTDNDYCDYQPRWGP